MSHATVSALERAAQRAREWIVDVANQFDTDDKDFAYRVTRAWLHVVRDRLPVATAAHFAAQLPELLRGIFYEGWKPSVVPLKYGYDEFVERFAADAGIAEPDVPRAARAVSTALDQHMSGHLQTVLETLPRDVRTVLQPEPAR